MDQLGRTEGGPDQPNLDTEVVVGVHRVRAGGVRLDQHAPVEVVRVAVGAVVRAIEVQAPLGEVAVAAVRSTVVGQELRADHVVRPRQVAPRPTRVVRPHPALGDPPHRVVGRAPDRAAGLDHARDAAHVVLAVARRVKMRPRRSLAEARDVEVDAFLLLVGTRLAVDRRAQADERTDGDRCDGVGLVWVDELLDVVGGRSRGQADDALGFDAAGEVADGVADRAIEGVPRSCDELGEGQSHPPRVAELGVEAARHPPVREGRRPAPALGVVGVHRLVVQRIHSAREAARNRAAHEVARDGAVGVLDPRGRLSYREYVNGQVTVEWRVRATPEPGLEHRPRRGRL